MSDPATEHPELGSFLSALPGHFSRAAREPRTGTFRIGGQVVRIESSEPAVDLLVRRAFGHLSCTAPAAFSLRVWAGTDSGSRVAPPSLRHEDIGPLGEILPLQRAGCFALFTSPGLLSVYRPEKREAFHWIADIGRLPIWEAAAPMRSLLGAMLRDANSHIVHAAGVTVNGRGALIVGDSGAGKSTTALACLDAGYGFLGDDYVTVAPADGGAAIHSLFGSAKAFPRDIERAGMSASIVLDDPSEPKRVAFVAGAGDSRFPASAPLRALLVPRMTLEPFGGAVRLPGARAVIPAVTSTASHTSGSGSALMRFLASVSRETPTFDLPLSPVREENPDRIARLLNSLP